MYFFDATYDEEGAAHAERVFYLRSITELRRVMTFGPPVLLAITVSGAVALEAPRWFIVCFSIFLFASVLGPLVFYFARPFAARKAARMYPVRHVRLTSESIEITAGSRSAAVPWKRVKHIWNAGEYVLLVLGKFGCISLPRRNLPEGAAEFMLRAVANAA